MTSYGRQISLWQSVNATFCTMKLESDFPWPSLSSYRFTRILFGAWVEPEAVFEDRDRARCSAGLPEDDDGLDGDAPGRGRAEVTEVAEGGVAVNDPLSAVRTDEYAYRPPGNPASTCTASQAVCCT